MLTEVKKLLEAKPLTDQIEILVEAVFAKRHELLKHGETGMALLRVLQKKEGEEAIYSLFTEKIFVEHARLNSSKRAES